MSEKVIGDDLTIVPRLSVMLRPRIEMEGNHVYREHEVGQELYVIRKGAISEEQRTLHPSPFSFAVWRFACSRSSPNTLGLARSANRGHHYYHYQSHLRHPQSSQNLEEDFRSCNPWEDL